MEPAPQAVLFDLLLLSSIALALGLGAFAWIRRSAPTILWQSHGNVWTGPFGRGDLALVLAFIALHFWTICAGGWGGVGSAPKAPLAAILFERMLPGTALVFYLGFARMIDVHEAFGLRRLGWKKISLWAIGGTAATALICVAVSHLYGEWILRGRWGAVSLAAGDSPQNARDPLVLAGAIAIAPLSEELIFRGFVYAVVKRYSERFFAAIISSAVFAIAHYDIPALAPLFALGMCLTVAYELSGCLWVPITIHAIFNALMAHPWFGG